MLLGQGGLSCEALPSWLSPIVTQERPQDHHDNHVEGSTFSQLHNIIQLSMYVGRGWEIS